jgi:hypothetical protein
MRIERRNKRLEFVVVATNIPTPVRNGSTKAMNK